MKSVVSLGVAVALIAGVACLATAQAQDKTPAKPAAKVHSYVGISSCKMCHNTPAQGTLFDVWNKTPHAKAFANLPAEGKKNPVCLACHVTGYGKAGGYDPASPNAAKFEGVTCEACHGPGADYKAPAVMKDPAKAKEAGLVVPDASTCKICHEGKVPEGHKALPKFDFATSAKVIEHHIPKK
jgi:hypothetical protein